MLQKVLFTHDDLDGAGCRVLFDLVYGQKLLKGDQYDVINCSNENVSQMVRDTLAKDVIGRHTLVFFGDIVCDRETLNILQNKYGCTVIILDHHRSNFWVEHEIKFPGVAIIAPENDIGVMQSGTSLMYQYFARELPITHPFISQSLAKYINEFVNTIRSYDTFEFKTIPNKLAERFQILFGMLGMERFCEIYLDRYLENPEGELIPPMANIFIDARLENEKRVIDRFTVDDVIVANIRGLQTAVLVKNPGARISELAFQFLSKHPELDMMASFSLVEGGGFQFRTVKDDVDTRAVVAEKIGGGGHPKASGAPMKQEDRDVLANIIVKYLNGDHVDSIHFTNHD